MKGLISLMLFLFLGSELLGQIDTPTFQLHFKVGLNTSIATRNNMANLGVDLQCPVWEFPNLNQNKSWLLSPLINVHSRQQLFITAWGLSLTRNFRLNEEFEFGIGVVGTWAYGSKLKRMLTYEEGIYSTGIYNFYRASISTYHYYKKSIQIQPQFSFSRNWIANYRKQSFSVLLRYYPAGTVEIIGDHYSGVGNGIWSKTFSCQKLRGILSIGVLYGIALKAELESLIE